MYLRPAGDARFHFQPLMIICSIVVQCIGNIRAWADQAHFSTNYIDQLRQLIQARSAQPAAGPRNSRILVH